VKKLRPYCEQLGLEACTAHGGFGNLFKSGTKLYGTICTKLAGNILKVCTWLTVRVLITVWIIAISVSETTV
jgi:hypothetical protein